MEVKLGEETKILDGIGIDSPDDVHSKYEYTNKFSSRDNPEWPIHYNRKGPQAEPLKLGFLLSGEEQIVWLELIEGDTQIGIEKNILIKVVRGICNHIDIGNCKQHNNEKRGTEEHKCATGGPESVSPSSINPLPSNVIHKIRWIEETKSSPGHKNEPHQSFEGQA